MPLLEVTAPINLANPVLILAIRGWVDGGLVASQLGEHLAGDGLAVARFDPDQIYDYQSNRPTVEFIDGRSAAVSWPELAIRTVTIDGTDLLVMTGTEPNAKWQGLVAELAGFAETIGVSRVITLGAVPAAVAHTRPTPIMTTSSDPALDSEGLPPGSFTVPGALVNIIDRHIGESVGIPTVGFWAQVPHYVSGVYWPGVEALVARVSGYLGIRTNRTQLHAQAQEMRRRLDQAVAGRPEAQRLIARLEEATTEFSTGSGEELSREVEDFLRSLGEKDNPFS